MQVTRRTVFIKRIHLLWLPQREVLEVNCIELFFFSFFCWGNYPLWLMTSNTVINAFASAALYMSQWEWCSNGLLWPSQVQCPACCLCYSPCMSATLAKTLWSLTSYLTPTLRVIIRFLWANSVMRATESGTSYSSFLWSSTQWSFWKSGSMLRARTTSGHCTQHQPSQTKSART